MFNNRDHAVYAAMINAHVDSYEMAPAYTRNVKAMELHSLAVEHDLPDLLNRPTGLTACREQHYALNRVDCYTANAMLHELRKCSEAAARCRDMAAKWYAYFNNSERQELANDEDDARCARAETAEAARLEEYYR